MEGTWVLLATMDGYAGFWWGRGLVGQPALPTAPPLPRGGHEHAVRDRPPVIERCRALVALVGDLVGLLFRLLVLAAFAWCLWQGLAVVADGREALQTEEGARRAGRTVDAFLSSLSAPALAVLGAGLSVLLVTVVFVLRGEGGGPRVQEATARAAPAAAPPPAQPAGAPWGPAWGWPGHSWGGPDAGWWWPQQPGGVANPRLQPLPGTGGGGLELEDHQQAVALAQPRRRGLGRHHTVTLLALCCVSAGPVGAGGILLREQEHPGAAAGLLNETNSSLAPDARVSWDYPAKPALRCGAWVLLHAAAGGVGLPGVPALVAECGFGAALELFAQGVFAGRRCSATGAAPGGEHGLPLSRTLAWKAEVQAVRTLVLLDAGVDEVGEGVATTGTGKARLLVLHRRNRRLDPYRGVRVGEASHPGPGSEGRPGKGFGKTPPKPPDHYATLGLTWGALGKEVTTAYRQKALKAHPDKGGDPEAFKRLLTAYETLSNPERRGAYDALVVRWHASSGGVAAAKGGSGSSSSSSSSSSSRTRVPRAGLWRLAEFYRSEKSLSVVFAFLLVVDAN